VTGDDLVQHEDVKEVNVLQESTLWKHFGRNLPIVNYKFANVVLRLFRAVESAKFAQNGQIFFISFAPRASPHIGSGQSYKIWLFGRKWSVKSAAEAGDLHGLGDANVGLEMGILAEFEGAEPKEIWPQVETHLKALAKRSFLLRLSYDLKVVLFYRGMQYNRVIDLFILIPKFRIKFFSFKKLTKIFN
jgi:hypothetical protein